MSTRPPLSLALLLLILGASLTALQAGPPAGGETPAGPNGKAHTPPAGDPERNAILDTLRIRYGDMVFVVDYLKVKDGWAWIEFSPRSRDGTNRLEGDVSLLRHVDGRWKEVGGRAAGAECEEDPDCADDQRFFRKLKADFPDLPMEILPQGGQGSAIPSHDGKTIVEYYRLIPKTLLNDHKYAIEAKNGAYTSRSSAGYEIQPLVLAEIGYLQIIDKGTGGGQIRQDVSFLRTNEGDTVLRIHLLTHDGVGPVCALRCYALDGQWTDVTSRFIPEVNIAHFLDENYLVRHGPSKDQHPQGVEFIYEFREHDGPMFARVDLERFAQVCPPTPEAEELVKNIKYENVRLVWDESKNALIFSGKGYFDATRRYEVLERIRARRRP
jgi:hypothetical protein